MQACILRGASEIGGSCVALRYDGATILLDLGLPLDGGDTELPQALPDDPLAVLISHNHVDHMGLVDKLPETVAIYGPVTAREMMHAGAVFTSAQPPVREWRPLRHKQPVAIGPFTVTPWSVDHSAYESFAFLVEAGGRRLLYSGDLRAHGRKPGTWRVLMGGIGRAVHTLVLEGTTLSRPDATTVTETDVELAMAEQMEATPGMVLACYSGHHMDRLVTVYRAAKRANRKLVLDAYGAAIAATTKQPTIPQASWSGVRLFLPQAQRRAVIRRQAFDALNGIGGQRIHPEELAADASSLVMTARTSMTAELEAARCLDGASAIWSMWSGYLERDAGAKFASWCETHGIALSRLHSSGHAAPGDLRLLSQAIGAERVVPIHTAAPEAYLALHERVAIHADREWWSV